MVLYCIYANPKTHPGKFVVRRLIFNKTHHQVDVLPYAITDDLVSARAALPEGLYRLAPMPGDDPVVVETWF